MALQHAAEIARLASKAKGDFLSRMSHDMRTPLNAILGMVQFAIDENTEPKISEYLTSIDVSGQYLLTLINDTLDLSKIESGKMELHREPFTLQEFLLGINTVIRPLMDAKKIEFILNLKDEVKQIMVDKMRFNQVFYNLLSNAAKYTPEGGRVEFSSEPIEEKDKKFGMRFCVRDNGIGMSKEFQKVLFEPFSQEFGSTHKEQKGTGLGLAIVKQIVELAGGSIRVHSEPLKGTEFIIDLYAHRLDERSACKPLSVVDTKKLRGIRILLVDDTEINSFIVKKMLELHGCIVDTAKNGQESLCKIETSEIGFYDVIMTDIRMPIMDGFEEARRIRAMDRRDAKEIPIIAETADAYEDIMEKILDCGMNARLVKPIKAELLYETVIKLTEQRYMADEQREARK